MSGFKVRLQSFGRFLSAMIMPNIGAFIAWGLITALFIPTGWLPNESLAKLVGPMIMYLLPLLIGYTGGKLVYAERGAVLGAVATLGMIVGTSVPMFLGAMIAGPLGGYIIKQVDTWLLPKIKSGFEMLVQNFSAGIVGALLAILAYLFVGPVVESLSKALAGSVNFIVDLKLLPLVSIFVEPAKIFFLNNAINHGIFTPLGAEQVVKTGKSIFYLIETNPGPGLGVLLAYMAFGKGVAKQSASGASIIHFFGGIHEIYFPYVLMRPILILAVIAGGMSGVAINMFFDTGLTSVASPGSIVALMLVASKGSQFGIMLAVLVSASVSFVMTSALLKRDSQTEDIALEQAQEKAFNLKSNAQRALAVRTIVVACDAGMGSSAMGASLLRKKINNSELNIEVKNCAINDLTADVDIVITHKDLTARAKQKLPNTQHLSLSNFVDNKFYDDLISNLQK